MLWCNLTQLFHRFHKIGLMVLFLHDIGDIMLEMSKTVVYCKFRGKQERPYIETAANILFLLFTFQWYVKAVDPYHILLLFRATMLTCFIIIIVIIWKCVYCFL